MKQYLKNKIVFLSLLFLLTSCSKSSYWNYNHITNNDSSYNTSILTYSNPYNFIELELINIDTEVSCFLNIISSEISSENSSSSIPLTLTSKTDTFKSIGYIRKGNQRISLNSDSYTFLIDHLMNSETVTIKVDQMEESINPIFFSKYYKKLLESNSFYTKLVKSLY